LYDHAVSTVQRVGIVGASGYAGAELLRLCAQHPYLEVVAATGDSQAGTLAASLYPSLTAVYPDLVYREYDPELFAGLDVVFLAMPHGKAMDIAPDLLGRVRYLVDVSADFRLKDPALYPRWYGEAHTHPELLPRFTYGLPELHKDAIRGADALAAPGCYVTAAALALTPLVRNEVIETTGVIVDAASGVSGAGRALKHTTHFCTVDEDFTAYGLVDHRHTPEIEQVTGAQVLFTPHLAPMNRGILATCYARPVSGTTPTTESLLAVLGRQYRDEPFVVVRPASPSTKATLGSNSAHLSARFDPRTGWVIVLCAIDNLVKGTGGQAIQSLNLMLGLPEDTGLPKLGVYP
jgi:N-acetyl-gamma-glutamyl-phosphate reductase